jgi:hypothetical protein
MEERRRRGEERAGRRVKQAGKAWGGRRDVAMPKMMRAQV